MPLSTTIRTSSFLLEGHRDSVNAMSFNADLRMLASGDNSGCLILWDLTSLGSFQEIDVSFAGPVTALCWVELTSLRATSQDKADPTPALVVGFGTGLIAIYNRPSENYCFDFVKIIEAHDGAIEHLAYDRHFRRIASAGAGYPHVWSLDSISLLNRVSSPVSEAHPYICKGVHFVDKGESLLVTYTESHAVMKYDIEPWAFRSSRIVQKRIGFSLVDGDTLFIFNLSDGVDTYSLRTLQRIRHYGHSATINVPLHVALARQGLDWVVLGGVDGIIRIFDRSTGELIHQLEHDVEGRVQVIDTLSTHDTEMIAAASSILGQASTIQVWSLKEPLKPSQPMAMPASPTEGRSLKWRMWLLSSILTNIILIYLFTQPFKIPHLPQNGFIFTRHVQPTFIPSSADTQNSLCTTLHL